MYGKFKHITSLFLLLVFLLPSVVKSEHHHKHTEFKTNKGNHFHKLHVKCPICNYEFSVFSSETVNNVFSENHPVAQYCNNYRSFNYVSFLKYSFLLRAPPCKQV